MLLFQKFFVLNPENAAHATKVRQKMSRNAIQKDIPARVKMAFGECRF